MIAALCAACLSVAEALTQDTSPRRPQATFKSSVDLVPVDVGVIDRNGRPIDDLTPQDFTLTVDGKPRRIASAEFVSTSSPQGPPPSSSPYYSSNAHGEMGRLIMLVVDQANISIGRVRPAAESAIRFIKRLSPVDRVGLYAIPPPGPQIDFTSNHALIQSQLPRIAGQAGTPMSPQRFGVGEAARIERGDQRTLDAVADRECTGTERQTCMQELSAEARALMADVRDRTRASLSMLRAVMERLSDSATPKTLVYVSEALVIDDDRSQLAWVGPLAAKGGITLQVLRIEPPPADASSRRSSNRGDDVALVEEGLWLLAELGRGSVFRVVGNADGIFNRLTLEMSGYYLLGFEADAGDRDGKPHKIKVEVPTRRGVEIRARQNFSVEPPRVQTAEQIVAETLRAPRPATDIGLKATAYTFRETDSQKLRILIAADIDRSQNPAGHVAIGYALINARGDIVSSQFQPQLKAPVQDDTRTQHFVAAVAADSPGVYGLKIAVVDDAGRRGSVEHSFKAQLIPAGQVRTADLLIGENAGGDAEGSAPTVSGEFTDPDILHGYVELYGDSPDALQSASVMFEIAAKEDSRPLESVAGRLDDRAGPASRRTAEGILSIALLPAGEYHMRAVVSVSGRRTAQLIRPVRVLRSSTAAAAAPAGRGRVRPRSAVPFTSRIDPFQRSSVLTPQVVGFFVDRLSAGDRAAVPPEAVEHARAGRFDDALNAARARGHQLAAAFLTGMTLYARGDLEAAAVKFREALRLDSEFFPAVFYLGACYAAGGRDRDASSAWQTSLVAESDAPFVYTLLGDALLRQREIDRAVEVLQEAFERWPEDPQVQMRLGTALAMAGRSSDALRVLDTYLSSHSEDADRLFLALRVIYETHAAGRTIGTREEDRARFDRYATSYAAASGAQVGLVEQWRKFVGTGR